MANTYKKEIVEGVAAWAQEHVESGIKKLGKSNLALIMDSVEGINSEHNAKKYLNHVVGYKLEYIDDVVVEVERTKVVFNDVMIDEDGQMVDIVIDRIAGSNKVWRLA